MNGLGFERYVANLLRAQGLTVYRSAASRGCADLVVSNDERQYLTVQCKKHGRVRYVRESGRETSPPETPAEPTSLEAVPRTRPSAANDVPDSHGLANVLPFRKGPARLTASARSSLPLRRSSYGSNAEDEEASRA